MPVCELDRIAENLRSQHVLLNSWNLAAKECGVKTPDGKPNPRLAQMIADGYVPKLPATRSRLGLPPICPVCYQRMPKPPRVIPDWLKQATDDLFHLEHTEPIGTRVYTRGGRLVKP